MQTGHMTADRQQMRQMARVFAAKEVLPVANRPDPEKGDIPQELIERMGNLGSFGILIPEDLGVLGLGVFEYCIVAEVLSRAWISVGSINARGIVFYPCIPGESNAIRRERIAQMPAGQFLGAFSMSEPNAASDITAIICRAVRDGDEWVVTSSKYWCTFADRAGFLQAICRTKVDARAAMGRPNSG